MFRYVFSKFIMFLIFIFVLLLCWLELFPYLCILLFIAHFCLCVKINVVQRKKSNYLWSGGYIHCCYSYRLTITTSKPKLDQLSQLCYTVSYNQFILQYEKPLTFYTRELNDHGITILVRNTFFVTITFDFSFIRCVVVFAVVIR